MKKNTAHFKNDLKKAFIPGMFVVILLAMLSACRIDSRDPYNPSVTHIFSDLNADGDIAYIIPQDRFIVSSAVTTGTVLAGIDPVNDDEYRGFLDFDLREVHGVPYHAEIESATLEIFINDVSLPYYETVVPLILDLVYFQPPTLIESDFNRSIQPPLLSLPLDIWRSDEGTMVAVDVTAFMVEVQNQGYSDFQVRLVLDSIIATSGLIEIEDNIPETAPMLKVVYHE
jgi:hypothetical protein